jgi:hypothetical protein
MKIGQKRNFRQMSNSEDEIIKRKKLNSMTYEEVKYIQKEKSNIKILPNNFTNFSTKYNSATAITPANVINKPNLFCKNIFGVTTGITPLHAQPTMKRNFSYTDLQTQLRSNFKKSFEDVIKIKNNDKTMNNCKNISSPLINLENKIDVKSSLNFGRVPGLAFKENKEFPEAIKNEIKNSTTSSSSSMLRSITSSLSNLLIPSLKVNINKTALNYTKF